MLCHRCHRSSEYSTVIVAEVTEKPSNQTYQESCTPSEPFHNYSFFWQFKVYQPRSISYDVSNQKFDIAQFNLR